ncbi:MAG: flippase-like domain-containing protein [Anaerolineaceae bacterium]|nr:flippase-like domain-containing protein [Anaerolineaceae bacterium]
MNLKRIWPFLRLALGVLLLILALEQIDWQAVGSAVMQVSPGWLLLALASFLITQLIKIMRWGWLAGLPPRPWLGRLSAAFFTGQAANILLPVRGGEVVRLGWLSASAKGESAITVSAGAALVLEKYLDMLALLILLALLLPVLPAELLARAQNWLLPLGIAASILILGSLWLIPLLWRMIRPVLQVRFGWNTSHVESWMERLSALRSARALLPSAAATLLIWLIMWLTNLLVLRSLHLPVTLPGAALSLALIYAGLIPAVMPGNFGPFYFFAMLGLAPYGISTGGQAAFAILLHALVTLPPLLISGGLLLAPRLGKRDPA